MHARERAVALANELAKLPEHYREVIVLRNLQSLSFEEIATRMDKSVELYVCYGSGPSTSSKKLVHHRVIGLALPCNPAQAMGYDFTFNLAHSSSTVLFDEHL